MRCWLVPYVFHVLRYHPGCSLLLCIQSIILNNKKPRILSKVFTWAKTHGYCGVEFEERSQQIWAFVRCWDNSQFCRVCVSILSCSSSIVSEEVVVLGRIIDALGANVRVVSVHGGPHALPDAYVSYLGSGYQQKLMEYPFFVD